MALLPFGRRVLDRRAQGVHAGDEALDEVLVVGLSLQHFVDDGEVQRVVAVRAHLPVAGGLAGRDGGARIDVGDAHPVRHGGHEGLGLLDHERFDDVAAVEHEVLRVLQVEDEPGGAEAVDRAPGIVSVPVAGGVVVEVVRRAERLHEGLRQVGEGAAAIGKHDAARAEGLDRLLQLVGDVVEGFVPGRPPPLAAAARARADERRLRPLVVELEGEPGRTLRTEAGADRLVARIALYPGDPTVLDGHFHRAPHRAHAAHAVDRAPARGAHAVHVWCHGGTHSGLLCSGSASVLERFAGGAGTAHGWIPAAGAGDSGRGTRLRHGHATPVLPRGLLPFREGRRPRGAVPVTAPGRHPSLERDGALGACRRRCGDEETFGRALADSVEP